MLTLKELKKIVKVADMEKRIPSVKSLKEHKVVVKEMINADTTISVYDHGYVLYTAGNQSTVFYGYTARSEVFSGFGDC